MIEECGSRTFGIFVITAFFGLLLIVASCKPGVTSSSNARWSIRTPYSEYFSEQRPSISGCWTSFIDADTGLQVMLQNERITIKQLRKSDQRETPMGLGLEDEL